MLGAIAGDIIGSVYEVRPVTTTDFDLFPPGSRFTDDTVLTVATTDFDLFPPGSRFTDDTVLTVATAEALLGDGDYAGVYRRYGGFVKL